MGNYLHKNKVEDPETLALNNEYIKAGKMYEKMAILNASNDFFFRACICYLIDDVEEGKCAFTRFKQGTDSFLNSYEKYFLEQILMAIENKDLSSFTNATVEYNDKINGNLDNFSVTMLLRLKNSIVE